MSDIMTVIRIPQSRTHCSGFQDYGKRTVPEMIVKLRSIARREKEQAEEILAAPDSAFQIDVVRGSIVQHHIKELQHSDRIEVK